MPASRLHQVEPGTTVDVAAIDAADTSAAPGDKEETEEASAELAERMAELQEVLWARRDQSVLVVLQGMDTSGKGGTVEHVMGAVNPAGLVPEERWRRRYDHINAFEQLLVDEGTTVVKLFLHISKDEQAERLQARLDEPDKHWKFRVEDLETRSKWGAYQDAFSEAITRTSTEHAPWHVIPADKKWYRNWAAATILVDVLESLDLTYPEPEQDLSDVVIR
jgi:polyphosphate kinase 2 (PPK2 family)